ncbi:MAG: HpcH/HpaI aldolase family protein [Bryobacteraceae bacterium]
MRTFPSPSLRQALNGGKTVRGVFTELGCPEPVELAAIAGWDFALIDAEHGPLTAAHYPALVRAGQAAGMPCVIRVPANEPSMIQHALDSGAAGVQIPQIATVDQARAAIDAARFHPQGKRGFNPFVRAANYAATPVAEFLRISNDGVLVVLQLESASGVGAAAEVAALPGVDVLFVGPYDLSQSLGIPGQVTDPSIYEAAARIARSAARHNVALGVFTNDTADARRWIEIGVRYVTFSIDSVLLRRALEQALGSIS